ncbi:MAG: alpha/beta hydrolase [Pirellulaceae bacterium]
MSATYQFERQRLGALDCGIVRPSDTVTPIRSLAVLCHGFGAGGDDLVGLASEILQISPNDGAAMMVFPTAPLSLDDEGMPGGRAWWMLSIQRLMSAIEDGRYEQIREEVPDGIDDAREKLTETIEAAMEIAKVDYGQLLLGGFSQGAMLSVDTATRGLAKPPAAMCLFSGCLICEKKWKAGAARLDSTKIFQSHGRIDPVLPLQTGIWLRDMLQESDCTVDFHEFNGVHTIPMHAIEKAAELFAGVHDSK